VLLVLLAKSGHRFFDGAIFGALALFLTKHDVHSSSMMNIVHLGDIIDDWRNDWICGDLSSMKLQNHLMNS